MWPAVQPYTHSPHSEFLLEQIERLVYRTHNSLHVATVTAKINFKNRNSLSIQVLPIKQNLAVTCPQNNAHNKSKL